jgi:ABC-2 type transport system permease protein
MTSYLRESDFERKLRIYTGTLIMALFFAGSLYFFYYMFNYLAGLKDIGYLLIDKILSIGFLAIFIMLVISNIITAISTLYRSEETVFYFATPVSHLKVFAVRFFDNVMYSTWGVLLLGIPIIIAYGLVRDFQWWKYFIEILFVMIPFTVVPACIGVGFTIILYMISRYVRPRTIFLFIILAASLGIVAYFKLSQSSSLAHNVFADWRVLNRFLGSLAATSFPYLPSYWIAETLKSLAVESSSRFWVYLFALVSTTAMLLRFLFVMADKLFYTSWQTSMDMQTTEPSKVARNWKLPKFFRLPDWLPSDFRSVLAKDLKLFVRDPAQWGQFSVLLVLLIIYLVNLRHFPHNVNDRFWHTVISFANFAFTGFILATLSVRFVYPNISLEGKSFWAITSSPMSIKRLFWEKFWLAFIIFAFIAEILAFISNMMLGLTGYMMILSFFSILLMSMSLTSLSVGMGALFPRFEESNPGRIASSMGGMITTVLSLIYVGFMVIILALPTYQYGSYVMDGLRAFPTREFLVAGALIIVLNLTTILFPIKIGLKSLSARDF